MASRPRRTATKPAVPAAPDPAIDFRAIVESMPDIVYALDLEGRITYLSPRAYEVSGYDHAEGAQFIGRDLMAILFPGASVVGAIRHRVEFPRDRQVFRVEARDKAGRPIPLEVHGGPLMRDGQVVGRIGVCRVLDGPRGDGAAAQAASPQVLHEDRMRIARGLRDAIAQIVFGITADSDASESFLSDVKRATLADLARRLRLDDVDLSILRLVASGASNREIASRVHLSAAAVKDRIRRLMTRLGTRRRAELATHALRLGIV